jgi:hypothetical protein
MEYTKVQISFRWRLGYNAQALTHDAMMSITRIRERQMVINGTPMSSGKLVTHIGVAGILLMAFITACP